MDDAVFEAWRRAVKPRDTILCLGDAGARRRPALVVGATVQDPQGGSRRSVDLVVAVEPAKQAAQRAVRE